MFVEAIKSICAAEEEARLSKLLAHQSAREAVEEAIKTGEDTVASTLARAESDLAHLRRLSDQKAEEYAIELASVTANRRATMRARAERLLEVAAALIVERVKGDLC